MAINETISTGRKFRKCIDNTPGNKKWLRYSFWTKASDVEFNDGLNAESKFGSYKGVTTNENQVAGFAADITLVKSIKTAFEGSISSLQQTATNISNLLNSTINRFGGMRFYEDATGKYVVGADSVPKKLDSFGEILRIDIGNADQRKRKTIDIKPLYSGYANLTRLNFAFSGSEASKSGAQGQNDNTRHSIDWQYDPTTGILTTIPKYREWGPDYDRSGEGYGWGPDTHTGMVLFALKIE